MDRFFDRFDDIYSITLGDLIPESDEAPSAEDRLIYFPYIKKIVRRSLDDKLRFYRQKALVGALHPADFSEMNQLLEVVKGHAQHRGYMMPLNKESGTFYAYARVNSYAMLIAQILFVNNAIQEGLIERIERASVLEVIEGVSGAIKHFSQQNEAAVGDDEARFYATVFLLQKAFDKIFVPDNKIVEYDEDTGIYTVNERYDECTSYLELSNRKVITATTEEKAVCYNLTTGWSEGIDWQTWDKLNAYYYEAISPTTGEVNLFTRNYDVLLERMLPQFTFSKIKLSEAVLEHKDDNNRLKVLEIGAGSGSFAVDLIMSCKRERKAYEEIDYCGVEPSEYMRGNFRTNTERKIRDTTLPENWELVPGSLEAVDENPEQYLTQDCATVIVFSYCAHHCFHQSLKSFFENDDVKKRVDAIYILDVTKEHGWTKPYYMWADCESPENFDNVLVKGKWDSETLWLEPRKFLEGHAVTNSWCSLRRLQ